MGSSWEKLREAAKIRNNRNCPTSFTWREGHMENLRNVCPVLLCESSPICPLKKILMSKVCQACMRGGGGEKRVLGHLGGEICQGLGDCIGARSKGLHLKDAHGSVPDDGLGALQGRLELLDGLGANVQALRQETGQSIERSPLLVETSPCRAQATPSVAGTCSPAC